MTEHDATQNAIMACIVELREAGHIETCADCNGSGSLNGAPCGLCDGDGDPAVAVLLRLAARLRKEGPDERNKELLMQTVFGAEPADGPALYRATKALHGITVACMVRFCCAQLAHAADEGWSSPDIVTANWLRRGADALAKLRAPTMTPVGEG